MTEREKNGGAEMRKIGGISVLLAVLLALTGCAIGTPKIESMKGWSFQHNSGTDDYSLFFGLCDKNDKYVSADAEVAIRIVNSRDELVYSDTKSVTKQDFATYSNQVLGDRYLANVRIAGDELEAGSSADGTVYFTVTCPTAQFDEAQCEAYHCLPIKDIQLEYPALPQEIQNTSYFGLESKVSITDVSFSFDKSAYSPSLKIAISGEVLYEDTTYGLGDSIIDYKLLDSEGYVVKTGSIYLDSALSAGDKFRDDSVTVYDVIPGETYTIQFFDYAM